MTYYDYDADRGCASDHCDEANDRGQMTREGWGAQTRGYGGRQREGQRFGDHGQHGDYQQGHYAQQSQQGSTGGEPRYGQGYGQESAGYSREFQGQDRGRIHNAPMRNIRQEQGAGYGQDRYGSGRDFGREHGGYGVPQYGGQSGGGGSYAGGNVPGYASGGYSGGYTPGGYSGEYNPARSGGYNSGMYGGGYNAGQYGGYPQPGYAQSGYEQPGGYSQPDYGYQGRPGESHENYSSIRPGVAGYGAGRYYGGGQGNQYGGQPNHHSQNPYGSGQGAYGNQSAYGYQGAQGGQCAYGNQNTYGYQGAQGGQGAYGNQNAYGSQHAYGGQSGYGQSGREGGWQSNYGGGMSNLNRHGRRGPKGYTRSDERIREDLSDRLMQQEDFDAGDVEIDVSDGAITLKGEVDSRQCKYHVEELADSIAGVKDVNNQLRVRRQNESRWSSSTRDNNSRSKDSRSNASRDNDSRGNDSRDNDSDNRSRSGLTEGTEQPHSGASRPSATGAATGSATGANPTAAGAGTTVRKSGL